MKMKKKGRECCGSEYTEKCRFSYVAPMDSCILQLNLISMKNFVHNVNISSFWTMKWHEEA